MDYRSNQNILVVGEDDFSFSLSLAREFGTAKNMFVASLIPIGDLLSMRHLEAFHNMKELEELGCTILTEFNPKTMAQHPLLLSRKFHRMIYNFPHAVFRRPECEASQIQLHKNVVRGFLHNAKLLYTSNGEMHITLKEKHLFTLWDIELLASVERLKLVGEAEFDPSLYPGYNIKSGCRSSFGQSFVIGEARTFKFSFI